MTVSSNVLDQLKTWLERRRLAEGTPGLALAITNREGLVYTATFGNANIDRAEPVTDSTLFETGSTGKAFTALALLQLESEGLVDLGAPVTDYLPWFTVRSEFPPIRLHHLLSHTSGITAGVDFAPDGRYQVWSLRETEATVPPGTFFHYSNIGYKVLGLVLEQVAGARYPEIIRRRVLEPLGMTQAIACITNADRPKISVGYGPMFDDRPWWPGRPLVPATWLETDTADGSLAMTATDLATWLRMLMNRGAYPGGRLLTEAQFDRFAGRHIAVEGSSLPSWYGYGLSTVEREGHTILGHGGGMVGYFTGMYADLDTDYGVVVLINGPGSVVAPSYAVLDALRAVKEGRDVTFPPIADPESGADMGHLTGAYVDPDGVLPRLRLHVLDNRLIAEFAGTSIPLRRYGTSGFVSDHHAFDGFPVVVAGNNIMHGERRWVREGVAAPPHAPMPAEWYGYAGYYRSHNPWTTNFRVLARDGRLWLSFPAAPDGLDGEQPLVPLGHGHFRCGEDPRVPETISFDTIVEGVALRARLSIGEYVRAHDPLEATR